MGRSTLGTRKIRRLLAQVPQIDVSPRDVVRAQVYNGDGIRYTLVITRDHVHYQLFGYPVVENAVNLTSKYGDDFIMHYSVCPEMRDDAGSWSDVDNMEFEAMPVHMLAVGDIIAITSRRRVVRRVRVLGSHVDIAFCDGGKVTLPIDRKVLCFVEREDEESEEDSDE